MTETYSSIPPITIDEPKPHPLRAVFVTVLTLKVAVCALLLATASLAPPVAADARYMVVAAQ
jgi:hypothetical protein